jgi:hypothetical protein
MVGQLLDAVLVVVLVGVLLYARHRFFATADSLEISFFRPWRGDPWPRGVQEDDDARFNWAVPEPVMVLPLVEPPAHASRRSRDESRSKASGPSAVVEDLPRGSVETVRLDDIRVRHVD